ncbi:AzlC family ABC transporter permease [Staphylococcus aureus]
MATHLSFRQGVQECIPTLLGYAGVGISFGIVASYLENFSILEIILLCLVIYAGAAQFIMCALFIAGTPISAIVLTVFIVNSRMFLFKYVACTKLQDMGFGTVLD